MFNFLMKFFKIFLVNMVLGGANLAASANAFAEESQNYPSREIRLVIPYVQGSQPDIVARLLVSGIKRHFPLVTLIPENVPGASGGLAAEKVHQTTPDGYTLFLGRIASQIILPLTIKNPTYHWDDFLMVGLLEIEPQICFVPNKSPFKNLREFLDAVRSSPGKFKFGHTGEGTILNLIVRYLLHLEGLKQSSLQGVNILHSSKTVPEHTLEGDIDFACSSSGLIFNEIIKNNLRAIFSTSSGRVPQLPYLKNAREIGFPDLSDMIGWSALVGPKKMPKHVVKFWRSALTVLSNDPVWNEELIKIGAIQALGSVKDNENFMRQQNDRYRRILTIMEMQQ